MNSYIAHVCADVRDDCIHKVGAACGMMGWKPGEVPGVFCKNYQKYQVIHLGAKA
jgi:hypothetical protein